MQATDQQKAHVIIERHPTWQRLMDKEIVTLVAKGEVEWDEAAQFVFARKMRKYS